MQYRKPNRVSGSARVEQRRPREGPEVLQAAHWADAAPHRNRYATADEGAELTGPFHRRPHIAI